MKYEILITTMKKNKHDIMDLCKKCNIDDDALFANQCDENTTYSFRYNNHFIKVICTNTIGVSKNRNILLDNCSGPYCICIDDDCSLVKDYKKILNNFISTHNNSEFISFNGIFKKYNRLVTNKKTKRIVKFSDISHAGAPGFVFKKTAMSASKLRYDETVGVPNKICAGEDSLFYSQLLKKRSIFYRCSDVLFEINNFMTESSYYKGVDENYVSTRGYITFLLHRRLYFLYMIRHIIRFHKIDKEKSLKLLAKWFKSGIKCAKKHQ